MLMAKESSAPAVMKPIVPPTILKPKAATALIYNENPSAKSTEITMMPWNDWISSFLRAKLGDKVIDKVRSTVLWKHDEQYDLHQVTTPDTKTRIDAADPTKTAMFRYPSPGSQPRPNIPRADPGTYRDDPYNVAYYPIDTRRRGMDRANPEPELEKIRLQLMDENDPKVVEAKEKLEAGPGSSPGNKSVFATGPSDFDETGLRAAMSTSHEAMNKVLDASSPNHVSFILCCYGHGPDSFTNLFSPVG